MSRLSTFFLVAVAGLLAIFFGIYLHLRSAGTPTKAVGSPLFSFDPDDIRWINIHNGDASIELKRSYSGWQIMPEPGDQASSEVVKQLMEAARTTLVLDRIRAGELGYKDKLSEYGLRKSQLQLDFGGDRDLSLLFGKDSVDESRVYVRFENSDDVYVVSNKLSRMIQRPLQEFRDRRLTTLHPTRVDRLVLKRAGGEMELRKDGRGWAIIKPIAARADEASVSSFVEKILRTGIDGFVAEEGGDPGSFGLSEPSAEVQLFGEGERVPQIVRLGSAAPEGGVFARLIPRNVICRLPGSLSQLLAVDLASFRDMALARINLDMVDLIRIVSPASRLALRRTVNGWELDDGSRRSHVSHPAVQRVVDALAQIKSVRFEPATIGSLQKNGLEKPPFTVSFLSVVSENTPESTAGEQLVEELNFGAVGSTDLIPVHTTGSPEIKFVPKSALTAVPTDPASWTSP